MENICRQKIFTSVFRKRFGRNKVAVHHVQSKKTEQTASITDSALVLTLRLLQFIGMTPIIIKKRNSETYEMTVSHLVYVYDILLISFINGIIIYSYIINELERTENEKHIATTTLYILLHRLMSSMMLLYYAFGGLIRLQRFLKSIDRIKKIKLDINKGLYHSKNNRKKMCCFLLSVSFISPFVTSLDVFFYQYRLGIEEYIRNIEAIVTTLFNIQFILLVEYVNSAFASVNNELKEVQLKLSFDTIEVCRIKNARDICHLMNCFVETCNALQEIQRNESIFLLCHLVLSLMRVIISSYKLFFYFIDKDQSLELYYLVTLVIWMAVNIIRAVIPFPACQNTQKEIEKTKLRVGELMCHIKSQNDPLLDSLNSFYTQLILNNYTFTAAGFCNIGMPLISKIFGLTVTILMVLLI